MSASTARCDRIIALIDACLAEVEAGSTTSSPRSRVRHTGVTVSANR